MPDSKDHDVRGKWRNHLAGEEGSLEVDPVTYERSGEGRVHGKILSPCCSQTLTNIPKLSLDPMFAK